MPLQKDVELSIVLTQKKNAMEDLLPYQTLPYDFYIGYYIYDADVENLIGQVPKWRNAVEGKTIMHAPSLCGSQTNSSSCRA